MATKRLALPLQDQLTKAQKQQCKAVAKLEKGKREALQGQERTKQQLAEQTEALAASQKALADATSASQVSPGPVVALTAFGMYPEDRCLRLNAESVIIFWLAARALVLF